MHLIIGGAHQGKLRYALSLGYTEADVARSLPTDKPILYGLQALTREDPTLTAAEIPDCIVICDELGCGVVPMEAFDRNYRECCGRLCTRLAEASSRVHRVICGVGTVIKDA